MKLTTQSVYAYGLAETAALLNDSFSDYFVPIHFDTAALLQLLTGSQVDVHASQVVLQDGAGVAVGLIANRGWSCRLAAMGVIREMQGQGVGKWLLRRLIAAAEAAGQRRMELEVITANAAGVALYERCGFRVMRRLHSHRLPQDAPHTSEAAAVPQEIDIHRYALAIIEHGLPQLPWQISGEAVAHVGPPNRAYALQEAAVLVTNPAAAQIVVRGIVVPTAVRRQGRARRLMQALLSRHADKRWSIPAVCPEELDPFWQTLGFVHDELRQYQMELCW